MSRRHTGEDWKQKTVRQSTRYLSQKSASQQRAEAIEFYRRDKKVLPVFPEPEGAPTKRLT